MTAIKPGTANISGPAQGEISLYPLLSESERPSATTDFIDGCLSDQHHRMITDIREVSPRMYPTNLSVIQSGIEQLRKNVMGVP